MTDFSLVVPTYNEARNIVGLCLVIESVLVKTGITYEIIVVDDHSPDGTGKLIRDLALQHKNIRLIERRSERGLGTAVVAGWSEARGGLLGVIDGDFQHPPEILGQLLKAMKQDNDLDIAIASRNVPGGGVTKWSAWRRAISWAGTALSHIFLRGSLKNVRDPMSGCFIIRKTIINDVKLAPPGYKVLMEVLARAKPKKIIEIPYFFKERRRGGSKAGLEQYWVSLMHLISLSIETNRRPKLLKRSYNNEDIDTGYYYEALNRNAVQKYWQLKKFYTIYRCLNAGPVIDIGSGPGVFFYLYGNKINWPKINLDCSYKQIFYGRAINRNTLCVNGFSNALPFKNNSFSTVLLIETLEHLDEVNIAATLKEVFRILKINGKALISTPNSRSTWPLLEIIVSLIGPVNYRRIHITKFDIKKLIKKIKISGLSINTVKTIYVFSPFFAFFSKNLGDLIFNLEQKILPASGNIILVEATKC